MMRNLFRRASASSRAVAVPSAPSLSRALVASLALAALAMGSLALAGPAWAQEGDLEMARLEASREALEDQMRQLESAANSSAYSAELREEARERAAELRARLSQGDFRVGDRIVVSVRNQEQLSDTFAVMPGRVLDLPLVGEMPLDGVIRSDLEERLTAHIGRMVNNPTVRAYALVRLSTMGELGQVGFFTIPAQIPLSDALMTLGGPTRSARLDRMRIERANETIWEGEALQVALREGRTLDELGIRSGDRIVIPAQVQLDFRNARYVGLGLPAFLFSLTRIF